MGLFFVLLSFSLIVFSYFFSRNRVSSTTISPKNTFEFTSELDAELFFNQRVGYEKFNNEIYSIIAAAQEDIYIAMYSFNDTSIARLLEEKQREGVGIHIILPSHKKKTHNFLSRDYNLELSYVDSLGDEEVLEEGNYGAYMHHKFIIVDPISEQSKTIYGSTNLTTFQQKYDSNFIITLADKNIAEYFLAEFERLKKYGSGISKIRSRSYSPLIYRGEYVNGFFDLWFGPGYRKNSLKHEIINQIESAQSSIDVVGWRINDRQIYQALVKKSQEGITVRVIVDDYYFWQEDSVFSNPETWGEMTVVSDSFKHVISEETNFTKKESLPDTFNSFMHHHTLIIDSQTLVAGSSNWSYRGFFVNDESSFITDIASLVDHYQVQFDDMFNLLHGDEIVFLREVSNKIIFTEKALYQNAKDVIIYNEESHPSWLGSICEKIPFSQVITVSDSCNNERTRIFIINNLGLLIGSVYLNHEY